MSNETKYHIRKRMFLNRFLDMPAFVIAIVEDTTHFETAEEKTRGEIELSLADCNDRITFYFNLDTPSQRANSLQKIRRLTDVLNEFRAALETQAKSISKRGSPKDKLKTKSQTAG